MEQTDHLGQRSASKDDDRITRVGRLIRMTSINKLPQLFNVLKGDMSIVGPRPHALGGLAGDKLFWEVSQKYWLPPHAEAGHHRTRPGPRLSRRHASAIDLENRLQADLEYVYGWRLWRDIAIIVNTLKVIVHPRVTGRSRTSSTIVRRKAISAAGSVVADTPRSRPRGRQRGGETGIVARGQDQPAIGEGVDDLGLMVVIARRVRTRAGSR
ncbi:sugar transferase [Sphingomonas sp. MMS24-JH45]